MYDGLEIEATDDLIPIRKSVGTLSMKLAALELTYIDIS